MKTIKIVQQSSATGRYEYTTSKTTLVADVIHGSIPLSPLEKGVISTQVFNRLHNVLQNSTLYFTIPSNRTSRFSHSLGCLHLSGEIFRNSLLNADLKARLAFFRDAEKCISAISEESEFKKEVVKYTSHETPERLKDYDPAIINCQLFDSYSIPGLDKKDTYFSLLLFQAVRLAALLHDVGHPPFSHVVENAFEEIHDFLKDKNKSDAGLKLLEELDKWFSPAQKHNEPFHEALGKSLSRSLFTQLIDEIPAEAAKFGYDFTLIKWITLEILNDSQKHSILKSLHRIVDGDLDADRLDYLVRDQVMSGFSLEPLRIKRLTQSFMLTYNKEWLFLPTVRAIHNVEEFFRQRINLYKYAVFHHRAIKFDALLERLIVSISQEYLLKHKYVLDDTRKNDGIKGDTSKKAQTEGIGFLLQSDISGLWAVYKDPSENHMTTCYLYSQWDDAWLISSLRKHYFDLVGHRNENRGGQEINEVRLEELLSNAKQYFSLYKRGECFLALDKAFAENIDAACNWDALLPKAIVGTPVERSARAEIARLKKHVETLSKKQTDALGFEFDDGGFALSKLCQFLSKYLVKISEQPYIIEANKQLLSLLDGPAEAKDVMFVSKRIKPGMQSGFSVVNSDGELIEFHEVSGISKELDRAVHMFPPFFLFVYQRGGFNNRSCAKLCGGYGKALGEAFATWSKSV